MHIAGLLGPSDDASTCYMKPGSFISDITSMIQVCHRWKKVVRSSDDLWRSICQWRWAVKEYVEPHSLKKSMWHDPRLPRAIPGEEYASKWLDVCLRHGRCLWESGRGGMGGADELFSHYIMVAEVYVTRSKRRVMMQSGPLEVINTGIQDDDVTRRWRWRPTGDWEGGDFITWSYYLMWMPINQNTTIELLDSLEEAELTVEVILVDKKTNQRALLCAAETRFEPDDDLGLIQGIKGQGDTIVASDGISYHFGE